MADVTEDELHLTPTEDLLMQALSARVRLGEPWWTFDRRLHTRTVKSLTAKDLVGWDYGPTGDLEVYLTSRGRREYLLEGYRTPLEQDLRKRLVKIINLAWPDNVAAQMISEAILDQNGIFERTYGDR